MVLSALAVGQHEPRQRGRVLLDTALGAAGGRLEHGHAVVREGLPVGEGEPRTGQAVVGAQLEATERLQHRGRLGGAGAGGRGGQRDDGVVAPDVGGRGPEPAEGVGPGQRLQGGVLGGEPDGVQEADDALVGDESVVAGPTVKNCPAVVAPPAEPRSLSRAEKAGARAEGPRTTGAEGARPCRAATVSAEVSDEADTRTESAPPSMSGWAAAATCPASASPAATVTRRSPAASAASPEPVPSPVNATGER